MKNNTYEYKIEDIINLIVEDINTKNNINLEPNVITELTNFNDSPLEDILIQVSF